MEYQALKQELSLDPVALGYSGMTDAQAASKLNALDTGRTLNRTAVPVAEVFNAIVNADWPAVATPAESKLRGILQMQIIDTSNANTRTIIGAVFGVGTQTRTNLTALATRVVSRAEELGLDRASANDVKLARLGVW